MSVAEAVLAQYCQSREVTVVKTWKMFGNGCDALCLAFRDHLGPQRRHDVRITTDGPVACGE